MTQNYTVDGKVDESVIVFHGLLLHYSNAAESFVPAENELLGWTPLLCRDQLVLSAFHFRVAPVVVPLLLNFLQMLYVAHCKRQAQMELEESARIVERELWVLRTSLTHVYAIATAESSFADNATVEVASLTAENSKESEKTVKIRNSVVLDASGRPKPGSRAKNKSPSARRRRGGGGLGSNGSGVVRNVMGQPMATTGTATASGSAPTCSAHGLPSAMSSRTRADGGRGKYEKRAPKRTGVTPPEGRATNLLVPPLPGSRSYSGADVEHEGANNVFRSDGREADSCQSGDSQISRSSSEESGGFCSDETGATEGPVPMFDDWLKISSVDLVPGDIFQVPDEGIMVCDAVLLQGSVLMNEADLTGEPMPVSKFPLEFASTEVLDPQKHGKKHFMFCGTSILSSRGGEGSRNYQSAAPRMGTTTTSTTKTAGPGGEGGAGTSSCTTSTGSGFLERSCQEGRDNISRPDPAREDENTSSMNHVEQAAEHRLAMALVIATGSHTASGQMVRRMFFPLPFHCKFESDFVSLLIVAASVLVAISMLPDLLGFSAGGTHNFFQNCVGSLMDALRLPYLMVNPGVLASLVAAQKLAAVRLEKEGRVKSLELKKLLFAGEVSVQCLDKTGTITETNLQLAAIQKVEPLYDRENDEEQEVLQVEAQDVAEREEHCVGVRFVKGTDDEFIRGADPHPMEQAIPSGIIRNNITDDQEEFDLSSGTGSAEGPPSWNESLSPGPARAFWSARIPPVEGEGDLDATAPSPPMEAKKHKLGYKLKRTWLTRPTVEYFSPSFSGATTEVGAKPADENENAPPPAVFRTIRQFEFDQSRQVQSVVVEVGVPLPGGEDSVSTDADEGQQNDHQQQLQLQHILFTKGSFEAVAKRCLPATIPEDAAHRTKTLALEGYYVLAVACRLYEDVDFLEDVVLDATTPGGEEEDEDAGAAPAGNEGPGRRGGENHAVFSAASPDPPLGTGIRPEDLRSRLESIRQQELYTGTHGISPSEDDEMRMTSYTNAMGGCLEEEEEGASTMFEWPTAEEVAREREAKGRGQLREDSDSASIMAMKIGLARSATDMLYPQAGDYLSDRHDLLSLPPAHPQSQKSKGGLTQNAKKGLTRISEHEQVEPSLGAPGKTPEGPSEQEYDVWAFSSMGMLEEKEHRTAPAPRGAEAVDEDSADAVQVLREGGIRPVIVTGDNLYTALHVADRVGLVQNQEADEQAPKECRR
eukprot:g4484.t1